MLIGFLAWAPNMYRRMVSAFHYCCFLGNKSDRVQLTGPEEVELRVLSRSRAVLNILASTAWALAPLVYSLSRLLSRGVFSERFLYNPMVPELMFASVMILVNVAYVDTLHHVNIEVFDETTRQLRRLESLRGFISAVWKLSLDALMFCRAKDSGTLTLTVSPSTMRMLGIPSGRLTLLGKSDTTLVIVAIPERKKFWIYPIEHDRPVSRHELRQLKLRAQTMGRSFDAQPGDSIHNQSMSALVRLSLQVCRKRERKACFSVQECVPCATRSGAKDTMHCEARVTPLPQGMFTIVV